jgi:hypothetical protein
MSSPTITKANIKQYLGANNNNNNIYLGASVVKWLTHLPFTSKVAGPSLSESFLDAT